MWKRNLLSLAMLSLAFVSTAQAQWHPDFDAKIKASNTRAKTVTANKAHDRYANQEVSYRKSGGNEVAIESIEKSRGLKNQPKLFEPNDEPLWAKGKRKLSNGKLAPVSGHTVKQPGPPKPNAPSISNLVTDGEESSGTDAPIEPLSGETNSEPQAPDADPAATEPGGNNPKHKVKKMLRNKLRENKS